MKRICNIFGHKYSYYITQDIPNRQFRCCLKCGKMQEYKNEYFGMSGWFTLVQRTKKGAEIYFKDKLNAK